LTIADRCHHETRGQIVYTLTNVDMPIINLQSEITNPAPQVGTDFMGPRRE